MWFSSDKDDETEWHFKIKVIKGRGIMIGKTLVDPYVKIKLAETSSQVTVATRRADKTSTPEWNDTFSLTSKIYDPNRETIIIRVKDYDRFTRNDDVGTAQIPLFMLNLSRGEWRRLWFPLTGNTRGEILIEVLAENFDTAYPTVQVLPDNPLRRKELNQVQWRIGDMVTFAGTTIFSDIVRQVTHSPLSHCALVFGFDEHSGEPLICEANGKHWIVRTVPLSVVFRDRADNPMHILHLSQKQRDKFRKDDFLAWCKKQEGKKWDLWGTASAAWQPFRGEEDLSTLFCSELVAAAYREAGLIEHINATSATPIDCCRWKLWEPYYYQLKGEKDLHLSGYNSINPEYFGMLQGKET
eukprot:gb/GECH01012044.1/.p1 GENE.gb/GECH01012044.1/~~gb/GECH01012044.1/.p1  ORF type:complete len:355 (+),score=83.10 gb/GECH01012044.1/:1-1065(+)